MTVGIFGSNGFIGSAVAKFLSDKSKIIFFQRTDLQIPDKELGDKIKECDCLINLVGSPIIRRWTGKGLKKIRESRVDVTEKIVRAILIAEKRPSLFINGSAIGIYAAGPVHNESSLEFDRGFLGTLIQEWELSALKAEKTNLRVIIARFGVVIGKDGGLLKQLLPLFKRDLGGCLGRGKTDMSFIGMHDLCRAIEFIIENEELKGIINFTCPESIKNSEFTAELSGILNKKARFRVPVFVLKLAFGEGSAVILKDQKVFPKRLLDEGFIFEQPGIREILTYELVNWHGQN